MLSPHEQVALRRLPHLARLLYLQCLRPWRDEENRTGYQPDKPVSWSILASELTVDSNIGVRKKPVTIKQVRRASEQLERSGLVRRLLSEHQLLFRILLPEIGTIVTSKIPKGRRLVRRLDTPEKRLIADVPRDNENGINARGQEVGQEVGQPPPQEYIYLYKSKEKISECVFDPEGARQIFKNWIHPKAFSVTELNNHICEYFDFCERRRAKPSQAGLQNLLHSRRFYKHQRSLNQRTASEVQEAKRHKLQAIAIREEDTADRIHSNNIANRNPK